MDNKITSAFSENEIRQLAAECGFHIRSGSKISGQVFMELVVFNTEELKKQSLEDLSNTLETTFGVTVTKQSIHDRFNERAVRLLTNALQHLLKSQLKCQTALKNINGFNRILIKDSTCFAVDKSMKAVFPVSDRNDSTGAVIRIQFEYDALAGIINDLSIKAFRDQDNNDWHSTNYLIQNGDLIIRDLGYLPLKAINDLINNRKAFLLCRLETHTDVYKLNSKREMVKIDFSKEQKSMRQYGLLQREINVFVGKEAQLPMRMVIYDMPDDAAAEKIRKVRKERIRNGSKTIKKETLCRARLTIMLTNIPTNMLSGNNFYTLYSIRWQIELMFKTWKSIVNIDKVKKVKKERLQCYIYAKLIMIVMIWQFYWNINKLWYSHKNTRLSMFKVFKRVMENLSAIRDIYLGTPMLKRKATEILLSQTTQSCTVETRKGSTDYIDIVQKVLIQ